MHDGVFSKKCTGICNLFWNASTKDGLMKGRSIGNEIYGVIKHI